ncbi:hypothetical protein N0V82_008117 [Gnomoniopsis sp. IMI 355080]|nr:hypothetical protein N0V82_008117 [Gnomoniopsis sp. IMI 355080]
MSIQKVNGHIDAIDRKLGKSLKIAQKGNDLKLGDVVKLGRKTNSICSEINKSVKEYDGATPSAEEAASILKKMEKVVDLTEKELDLLVKSKARIDELHLGGLVKRNLSKSQEAGVAFSKQLLEKAPADLKDSATALEDRRSKAFEKAVSAFANAQGGEEQADEEDDSD